MVVSRGEDLHNPLYSAAWPSVQPARREFLDLFGGLFIGGVTVQLAQRRWLLTGGVGDPGPGELVLQVGVGG